MKELFQLKSFRKNFIFMLILLILVPISNYFNTDTPIPAGGGSLPLYLIIVVPTHIAQKYKLFHLFVPQVKELIFYK